MAGSAFAATVVVVVPAVLHPLVGVWTLLWLVPVAAVAGFLALGGLGPGAAGRGGREHGSASHPDRGPHAYPGAADGGGAGDSGHAYADGPAHGTRVGEIALATAVPDYDLRLSAVVHWRWSGHVDLTVRNPVAPAVRDVVDRAAAKVARTRPRDHARTECDLAAQLAVEHAVTGTGIVVWAEHVRLYLPEQDAERLARLSGLRKDLALRAALQGTERAYGQAHAPAHGGTYGDTHAGTDVGGRGHTARGPGGTVSEPAAGHGFGSAGARRRARPGASDGGEDLASRGPVHGPDLHGPGGDGAGPPDTYGPEDGLRSGIHGDDGVDDSGEEHDYVYLDPVHGMPEEPVFTGPDADFDGPGSPVGPDPGPLPGHDVDEYGYESYWWPAESIPDTAEEDVQVAILRGMIDAVPDRRARAEFAEQQLSALEKAGYVEVARRVREGF